MISPWGYVRFILVQGLVKVNIGRSLFESRSLVYAVVWAFSGSGSVCGRSRARGRAGSLGVLALLQRANETCFLWQKPLVFAQAQFVLSCRCRRLSAYSVAKTRKFCLVWSLWLCKTVWLILWWWGGLGMGLGVGSGTSRLAWVVVMFAFTLFYTICCFFSFTIFGQGASGVGDVGPSGAGWHNQNDPQGLPSRYRYLGHRSGYALLVFDGLGASTDPLISLVEQGWIDVANSVHTDSSASTGLATGQTPIVLARLPRVGAATPMSATMSATPQPVPPPEVMPQLELRTAIEQRTHLHIANTPTDEQVPAPNHFADRQHVVHSQPSVRQPSPTPAPAIHQESLCQESRHQETRHQESRRYDSTAKPQAVGGRPKGFSEKLFQIHAQLAPHAGLIVALALIASAGLLYWMIVGPTAAPTPGGYDSISENYDPGLRDEGFQATSSDSPEFVVDTLQAEEPEAVEPLSASDQWTRVPLPGSPQDESPSQFAQPKPAQLPEMPSTDELLFLKSKHPQALDFTKLRTISPKPTETLELQPFPEVARRPSSTTVR